MDLASKLALARKAKQLKGERRKNAQAARTRGQLMQRLAAGSGASSRGESPSSSVSDLHNSVPAVFWPTWWPISFFHHQGGGTVKP